MAECTRKQRHRWQMRLMTILLGCLPLILVELVLSALGLPSQPTAVDPYVDLHHLRPLFTHDDVAGKMTIGAERLHLFRPASFEDKKKPRSFRAFALGGSTTQGEPYSTETAFPEWLKLNLQAQSPVTSFEVINCGGLSYASYRVLAILREVLTYEPNLIVIYTGHNEFLEHRSYEHVMPQSPESDALAWLSQLRTVQFIKSLVSKPSIRQLSTRTELTTEVNALLDYAGGLEDYRRDDPWRDPIIEHFRWNVEQMIRECRRAGVPLILVRPVSNLIDCPPFKYEIDSKLPLDQQAAFTELWDIFRSCRDELDDPLAVINRLLAIDSKHAGTLYLKGRMLADIGVWEEAKEYFIAARDADVCPLRAITEIADSVTELAERYGVPLVDAEELFTTVSSHGIPGSQWLVDHVHPTIEGHQLIGETLAETCVANKIISATNSEWKSDRKSLYNEHLKQLGEEYFHRGKQRLQGLLLWTQGRAKKLKPIGN